MQFLINIADKIYQDFFKSPEVTKIVSTVTDVLPAVAISLIFVALGIIVMILGKKMYPFLKFLLLFTMGFIGAYAYIAPIISAFIPVRAWIIGLIVGTLCGLISKYMYILAIGGGCVFIGFFITNQFLVNMDVVGNLINNIPGGMGSYIAYAIVSGVCMLFVFPLLKWVETALTAVVGACSVYYSLVSVVPALCLAKYVALPEFNFDVLASLHLPSYYAVADLIVVGGLAVIGTVVQIVTRRRY